MPRRQSRPLLGAVLFICAVVLFIYLLEGIDQRLYHLETRMDIHIQQHKAAEE